MKPPTPVLEARDVVRHFPAGRARKVHAVNGVSLVLMPGETVALVGESGCGKSTLGRLLIGLDKPDHGSVLLEGQDITGLKGEDLRQRRRAMQMIFQDPMTALDPRWRVADLVREPLDNYGIGSVAEREQQVMALLARVGLGADHARRYPHEISGGQRQRIGIARALALKPKVIVADEPVSALDVSVRAQVVNLLCDLREQMGLSLLFVSHDIGMVGHISDRVAVMYLGQIVETGPTRAVLADPRHPYTRALLDAVPIPHPSLRRTRLPLAGDPPSPMNLPSGCRFADRCPQVEAICRGELPQLRWVTPLQQVACHLEIGPEPGRFSGASITATAAQASITQP